MTLDMIRYLWCNSDVSQFSRTTWTLMVDVLLCLQNVHIKHLTASQTNPQHLPYTPHLSLNSRHVWCRSSRVAGPISHHPSEVFLHHKILNPIRLHYADAFFYHSGLPGEAGGCASGVFLICIFIQSGFLDEGERGSLCCASAEKLIKVSETDARSLIQI